MNLFGLILDFTGSVIRGLIIALAAIVSITAIFNDQLQLSIACGVVGILVLLVEINYKLFEIKKKLDKSN